MSPDSENMTSETLISLWTKQLYLEHEKICYQQQVSLSPVTMRILPLKSQVLGYWNQERRSITISQTLIENYCWSVVLEVLKHEMAHQLISETCHVPEEPPHGKAFKQACHTLGVSKWAMHANISLDVVNESFNFKFSPQEETILRRAKKLLALAQSSNPNEASAAMNKVQALYERYHLSTLTLLEKPEFTSTIINHKRRRTEIYQTMIGSILVKYFYVQVIHSHLFDKDECCEHNVIELLGIPRHVQLAEYVYWYIYNNLPILWKEYKKTHQKTGIRSRNNYYRGVISGFCEKLEDSKNERDHENYQQSNQNKQLMIAEDKRLIDFLNYRHPKTRTTHYKKGSKDAESYHAGKIKGRELNIHQGLNEKKSYRGLHLPAASKSK